MSANVPAPRTAVGLGLADLRAVVDGLADAPGVGLAVGLAVADARGLGLVVGRVVVTWGASKGWVEAGVGVAVAGAELVGEHPDTTPAPSTTAISTPPRTRLRRRASAELTPSFS